MLAKRLLTANAYGCTTRSVQRGGITIQLKKVEKLTIQA
jgi:hypothetical protein